MTFFRSHGSWQISINNNVAIQVFYGSWNEEAVINYVKDFRQTVAPLIGSDWAILSVFEDWELGVPEIEHHVEEHCRWFIEHGCRKDCHVYSPSYAKQMQLDKMVPFVDEQYERRVFANFNDARQWLQKCQFELTDSTFIQLLQKELSNKHQLNLDNL
jgi:hypothetical protein